MFNWTHEEGIMCWTAPPVTLTRLRSRVVRNLSTPVVERGPRSFWISFWPPTQLSRLCRALGFKTKSSRSRRMSPRVIRLMLKGGGGEENLVEQGLRLHGDNVVCESEEKWIKLLRKWMKIPINLKIQKCKYVDKITLRQYDVGFMAAEPEKGFRVADVGKTDLK